MDCTVSYSLFQEGQQEAVSRLIEGTFKQFVAPYYPPEGVGAFMKYVHPRAILERAKNECYLILLALSGDQVVGMVELRGGRHVSLMFMAAEHQRRGLGRELLRRAGLEIEAQPGCLTVNSSPNAVPAYERMGFRVTGPAQQRDGIIFVPMIQDHPR